MELKGRNILVVGMERSGIAAAELLLEQGARVSAADQKPFEQLSDAGAKLCGIKASRFSLQAEGGFEEFDAVVISPGVPFDAPEVQRARDRGVPVIGELELAAPFLQGPHHRDHGLERQDHHHGADRTHLERVRTSRRRWAAISGRRSRLWSTRRGPGSGMYWSFRASSWRRRSRFARMWR